MTGICKSFKSSLLNFILKKKGVFKVGHTQENKTKGIWIYTSPIEIIRAGKQVDLYFLDYEGLGSFKNKNTENNLFVLALLLSSMLLFNSVGVLDQSAISDLSIMALISKQIQIKRLEHKPASEENESLNYFQQLKGEIPRFMPDFCWLLRDFHLQVTNSQGVKISEDQYLQEALEECKLDQNARNRANQELDKSKDQNRIRGLIKSSFINRKLFTFVRPTDQQTDLDQIFIGSRYLRPQFTKQVDDLREYVLRNVRPFTFDGVTIGTQEFCNLTKAYLKSINEGSLPVISDAWTTILQQQSEAALSKSIQHYKDKMSQLDLNKLSLNEFYKNAKLIKYEGTQLLLQSPGKLEQQYYSIGVYKSRIREVKEIYQKKIEPIVRKKYKQFLEKLYRSKIAGKDYDIMQDYVRDWNNLRQQFFKHIDDKLKYELFATMAVPKIQEGFVRINHNQLFESQHERKRLSQFPKYSINMTQRMQVFQEKQNEIMELKQKLRSKQKRLRDQQELLRDYDEALQLNQSKMTI